jgi:hypothetical protein
MVKDSFLLNLSWKKIDLMATRGHTDTFYGSGRLGNQWWESGNGKRPLTAIGLD